MKRFLSLTMILISVLFLVAGLISCVPADKYTLTVTNDGNGSVTLNPATGPYEANTVVTLTPVPNTNYEFDSWTGANASDVQENGGVYTITMSADKTIQANFVENIQQYTLTVTNDGNGSVTLDPAGGTYNSGTVVTLTPVPDEHYAFDSWTGANASDVQENGGVYTITMNANKIIQANFVDYIPYSDFVDVPGGTFTQEDINGNSFEHTIFDFQIGQYEITYDLWYTVRMWASNNGYTFANLGTEGHNGTAGAEPTLDKYEPVANISWRDAIVWCNAYSEFSGRTPVYTYDSNTIKDSSNTTACDNAVWDSAANGFRLPSEGEWHYAASYIDGTDWLPYNHVSGDETAPYDTSTVFGDYAWYQDNSDATTHPVGEKLENGLALYDMSGNVWEWCWDWNDIYPTTAQVDYKGAATGTQRNRCGASWDNIPGGLQIGVRYSDGPVFSHPTIGFRVAFSEPVAPTAPVFNPIPDDYETLPHITISASAGASIRYTTDGTNPSDTVGTLYTGPVNPAGKYTFIVQVITN